MTEVNTTVESQVVECGCGCDSHDCVNGCTCCPDHT